MPILFYHHHFQKIDRTLTKCYRHQNLLQNISTVNRANLSRQKQLQICRGSSTFVIYRFIDWVGLWSHISFHWNSCWQAILCQKCSEKYWYQWMKRLNLIFVCLLNEIYLSHYCWHIHKALCLQRQIWCGLCKF